MKHPLWLVNSIFLFLFIVTLGFVFLSKPRLPRYVDFMPEEVRPQKKQLPKIDLSKIYTNDLFGTYREQPSQPAEPEQLIKPIPKPPEPKPIPVPQKPVVKFLEPLPIDLKGIMIVGNDDKNTAIIEDKKTKESKNYRVLDKVGDGQLIRILKNKIIILRSNGQQETIYLTQRDAEIDQLILQKETWTTVVQKTDDTYTIDPHAFVVRVRNLARLIDMLNLTTVYQRGESIGCRVGTLDKPSLGSELGLQRGDIITEIGGIPATTTENRYDIYQKALSMKLGDTIEVKLLRNRQPMSLLYKLHEFEDAKKEEAPVQFQGITSKTVEEIAEEKNAIISARKQISPVVQEFKKQEKSTMLSHSTQHPQRKRATGLLLNNVQPEKIGA